MATANPVRQFQYIIITIYNTGHYCIYNPAGNNSIYVIFSNIPQYCQFFNTLFHMLHKFIFKYYFYIYSIKQHYLIMTIETTQCNRSKKAMLCIALIRHTMPGACPGCMPYLFFTFCYSACTNYSLFISFSLCSSNPGLPRSANIFFL